MYQYKYVRLHNPLFLKASFEGCREIIDNHAEQGWRYAGYIPVLIDGYGRFLDIDLIFEKKTDNSWK